jgi:hypothetical protein
MPLRPCPAVRTSRDRRSVRPTQLASRRGRLPLAAAGLRAAAGPLPSARQRGNSDRGVLRRGLRRDGGPRLQARLAQLPHERPQPGRLRPTVVRAATSQAQVLAGRARHTGHSDYAQGRWARVQWARPHAPSPARHLLRVLQLPPQRHHERSGGGLGCSRAGPPGGLACCGLERCLTVRQLLLQAPGAAWGTGRRGCR